MKMMTEPKTLMESINQKEPVWVLVSQNIISKLTLADAEKLLKNQRLGKPTNYSMEKFEDTHGVFG